MSGTSSPWANIISTKKVIELLAVTTDEFIDAIVKNEIQLLILPDQYLDIGIRHAIKIKQDSSENIQDNPLGIAVDEVDGFIPDPKKNEKILRNLNWKNCDPLGIVLTDAKGERARAFTPALLASNKQLSKIQAEHKEKKYYKVIAEMVLPNGIYSEQMFYFKDKKSINTKLNMENIFIDEPDLKELKHYFYDLDKPDFNNLGSYTINPWSNQIIKDINAIHRHLLKNNMIKDESDKKKSEKKVKIWLEERYRSNKKLTQECLTHIPKIVTDQHNVEIKFEEVLEEEIKKIKTSEKLAHDSCLHKAIYEKRKRNRQEANDIIILIDIIAEKHFKGKKEKTSLNESGKPEKQPDYKNYISSTLLENKMESAINCKGPLKKAIFSIIRHNISETQEN